MQLPSLSFLFVPNDDLGQVSTSKAAQGAGLPGFTLDAIPREGENGGGEEPPVGRYRLTGGGPAARVPHPITTDDSPTPFAQPAEEKSAHPSEDPAVAPGSVNGALDDPSAQAAPPIVALGEAETPELDGDALTPLRHHGATTITGSPSAHALATAETTRPEPERDPELARAEPMDEGTATIDEVSHHPGDRSTLHADAISHQATLGPDQARIRADSSVAANTNAVSSELHSGRFPAQPQTVTQGNHAGAGMAEHQGIEKRNLRPSQPLPSAPDAAGKADAPAQAHPRPEAAAAPPAGAQSINAGSPGSAVVSEPGRPVPPGMAQAGTIAGTEPASNPARATGERTFPVHAAGANGEQSRHGEAATAPRLEPPAQRPGTAAPAGREEIIPPPPTGTPPLSQAKSEGREPSLGRDHDWSASADAARGPDATTTRPAGDPAAGSPPPGKPDRPGILAVEPDKKGAAEVAIMGGASPAGEGKQAAGTSPNPDPGLNTRADLARGAAMQIAEVVRASGERAVVLRLQPEELGRVSMTLGHEAGALLVSLTAERPETLEMLRRNIEILSQELRRLGYEGVSFSFAGDGQEHDRADGGNRGGSARVEPAPGPDPTTPEMPGSAPPRPNMAGGSSMDIRI